MSTDELYAVYNALAALARYIHDADNEHDADWYVIMAAKSIAHREYLAAKFPEVVEI